MQRPKKMAAGTKAAAIPCKRRLSYEGLVGNYESLEPPSNGGSGRVDVSALRGMYMEDCPNCGGPLNKKVTPSIRNTKLAPEF